MRKLPQYSFNEGFYIWFDVDSKEEYYSTPVYMYKTDFNDDLKNYKRRIVQEKDFYKKKPSRKDSAPKHPATILYPFAEQFGRFLISLLYTSEKLSNIAFVALEQFVKNSNLPIKNVNIAIDTLFHQ